MDSFVSRWVVRGRLKLQPGAAALNSTPERDRVQPCWGLGFRVAFRVRVLCLGVYGYKSCNSLQ